MNDDEIQEIAETWAWKVDERYSFSEEELMFFSKAITIREREACVKLIEESADSPNLSAHNKFEMYLKIFMQRVADQIKAKG